MASFGIEGMSVMKKLFAVNVALLPALGLGVISSPVIAQVAESSASSDALTEIVVTAEKRDSTVLKTPISITAISGADLDAAGIVNLSTIATETPGVSIRSAGPGQNEIEMRGMTSNGGSAPTVGFYLDDVPLSPPAGANNGKVVIDPNLYDLDRVEMLRGPQGTLYGSGSMGGTVKLVTAQPEIGKFDGSIELTGSHTQGANDNGSVSFMLNLPVIDDTVALRLVGTSLHNSGWIDRDVLGAAFPLQQGFSGTAPPGTIIALPRGNVLAATPNAIYHDVNDEDLNSIRASLLVKLNDNLSITPSVFYQRITQGGANTYDNPPGTSPASLAHYQPVDTAEPFADEFTLASLVVKARLEGMDLTSSTSVWNREEKQTQDLAEDFQALVQLPFFTYSPLTEIDTSHQWSEELRLASSNDSALQWLVGGFYSQFRSNFQQNSVVDDWIPIVGSDNLITESQPQTIRQAAVFGNASYQISPLFKVTAGLRYYDYRSTMTVNDTGLFASGDPVQAFTIYDDQSASGVTPMASLAFTPTGDLTVYGSVAKGFRPGGGNQYVPISGPASCEGQTGPNGAPNTYGSDSVWSYELGEKGRLFDGRVTVNSAIYYEKWSNIQIQVPLACGFFYTANAESAGIYGTELEVKAKVTEGWTLSANGGYTHATYSKDFAPYAADPPIYSEGQRVPDVPLYTAGVAFSYDAPLFGQVRLQARIDDSLVGPIVDYTFGENDLPGHSIANARVGLTKDHIYGNVFVTNVADTRAALSDTNSLGANAAFLNRIATNQPRTIGLTVGYKFQ
jgi:outer membrane receptor protein involved in Fe transport